MAASGAASRSIPGSVTAAWSRRSRLLIHSPATSTTPKEAVMADTKATPEIPPLLVQPMGQKCRIVYQETRTLA